MTDLRALFAEAFDVSADAREAAKLAYLAVQTTQLDPPPEDGPVAAPVPAPRLLVVPPPEEER